MAARLVALECHFQTNYKPKRKAEQTNQCSFNWKTNPCTLYFKIQLKSDFFYIYPLEDILDIFPMEHKFSTSLLTFWLAALFPFAYVEKIYKKTI